MIRRIDRTHAIPVGRCARTKSRRELKGASAAASVTIRNEALNTTHVWHVLAEMQSFQIDLLSRRTKRILKERLQQMQEMLEALPNQGDELLVACLTLLELRLALLERGVRKR